jgi:uncharacterized membrane protein YqjE
VPTERTNIVELLQRVADLLVKLIGGKIELATTQVRETAESVARRVAWAVVGALIATVGVALLALAAVDALAPLVASHALRLLLVGAPLLLAGALTLLRTRASERGVASATTDERDHDRNDREHEQHVDPRTDGISAHHAEQPQHEQKRGDHPQHVRASSRTVGSG